MMGLGTVRVRGRRRVPYLQAAAGRRQVGRTLGVSDCGGSSVSNHQALLRAAVTFERDPTAIWSTMGVTARRLWQSRFLQASETHPPTSTSALGAGLLPSAIGRVCCDRRSSKHWAVLVLLLLACRRPWGCLLPEAAAIGARNAMKRAIALSELEECAMHGVPWRAVVAAAAEHELLNLGYVEMMMKVSLLLSPSLTFDTSSEPSFAVVYRAWPT